MSTEATVMKIAVVQPHLRSDDIDPFSAAHHVIGMMRNTSKANSIDLFVLPELCPLGYTDDTFEKCTNDLDCAKRIEGIDDMMRECAKVKC